MKTIWNHIISFFREEADKMRPLPFKQKVGYIWDYYHIPIIIVAAILIAGISLTRTIVKAHAGGEVVFGVGVANDSVYGDNAADTLAAGFSEYLGLVPGEQQVRANYGYTVGGNMSEYSEVLSVMPMVDAGAGNEDALICPSEAIEYFSDTGDDAWLDLRTVLTDGQLKQLESRLYYTKNSEGELYPCGIYVKDLPVFSEITLGLTDPVAAFPIATKHMDYIDDFILYLCGGSLE